MELIFLLTGGEQSHCSLHKIAVVGCGWLGLPLAQSFLDRGYEVLGTTRNEDKLEKLSNLGIKMSLLNFTNSELEVAPHFFDDVTVCFLNIPPNRNEPSQYANKCLAISKLLPEKCQLIFASSTGVYLDVNKVIKEDELEHAAYRHDNPVLQAEKDLSASMGKQLTIIRFAGLIGPNRNPASYFSGKSKIKSGLNPVNLIHLNDCVRLVQHVIDNDQFGHIIHACYDGHPARMDYYSKVCKLLNIAEPEFISQLDSWKIIDSSYSQKMLSFDYLESL